MILQNKLFRMIRTWGVLLITVFMMVQMVNAQTLTVDEIIKKNVQASGGEEKWSRIKNMKMSGTYTNFSNPEDFTIWRKRPDLYRFDSKRINMFTIHAYDGKKAWWVNPLMGPPHDTSRQIPSQGNLDLVTLRERFFDPVFWNYKKMGNKVTLVGKENLDGEDVYHLKVTLKDGSEEHWYIDADTYLVTAMTGISYDFGMKCNLEAFYSDYRDVDGVKWPFLIEIEYGTRYRTFEFDEVELNADFKPDVFVMPDSLEWVERNKE